MDKLDFQKLMEQTFKSPFLVNILTKLYSKEISQEDYKKLLSEKKSEIEKQNPSFTETQKYQALMTSTEEKLEIPNSSSKLLEPKEKSETPEKKEKQFLPNFPFYYIIVLLFIYSSSLFLTASNVKFGKPVLVHNNELKSDIGNFRFLENVNENKTNFELYSEEKNMKLNFKDHSFLIMPKMKKKNLSDN